MLFDLIMEKLKMKKPKETGPLCIFTDGSGNRKNSGYGIFAGPGNYLNRSVRLMEGTHEDGEIQAVIQTLLELLKQPNEAERKIIFFTDCLFILKGLEKSEQRGGKAISKKRTRARNVLQPLPTNLPEEESFIQKFRRFWDKYEDHLKVIEHLSSRCLLGVIFVHVPAHREIFHNEVADILAKMAIFDWKTGKIERKRLGCLMASNKNQIKADPIGARKLDYVIVKKNDANRLNPLKFPGIQEILKPEMEVIWKPGTKKLHENAILALFKGKEKEMPRIGDFLERMERKESIFCKEVFGID